MAEAFEAVALAMFNYMTDLSKVKVDEYVNIIHDIIISIYQIRLIFTVSSTISSMTTQFTVQAADRGRLLFKFLDELLYRFVEGDRMVCSRVNIVSADWENNSIQVEVRSHVFSDIPLVKKNSFHFFFYFPGIW
jgi:SHS2 domain-containing protein